MATATASAETLQICTWFYSNQRQDPHKITHRRIVVVPQKRDSSIEIAWEQSTIDYSQRIALYAGPDASRSDAIHATMRLPPDTVVPSPETERTGSVMVLATIQEHEILCCMIHPLAVLLFDIFPDPKRPALIPSEGWTIPLPFHCVGVYALPGQGILLHRHDGQSSSFVEPSQWKSQFQSKVPAPPFTSPQPHLADDSTGSFSLFSLHHPLEEILPVSTNQFTDVQKILWVQDGYMVALGQHQKYAMYCIGTHPPQAPPRPLYQTIHERYDTTPEPGDPALLLWESDSIAAGQPSSRTRNEALADALGVSPQNNQSKQHQSYHRPASRPSHSPVSEADLTSNSGVAKLGSNTTTPTLHEKLRPKVVVSLLHVDNEIPTNTRDIFLIKGLDGERVLAIQEELFVKLYALRDDSIVPLAKLPSISSQPVATVENALDLLILDPQNEIHLYRAVHFICHITILGLPSAPTSLRDSTNSRVSVSIASDQQCCRIAVDMSTTDRCEQLLLVFGSILPELLVWKIRLHLCRGATVQQVMATLVRQLLGVPSPPVTKEGKTDIQSAWGQLLESEYHREYQHQHRGVMSTPTLSEVSTAVPIVRSSFPTERVEFAHLFDILHLLYEERKVSGDTEGMAELLATLIECCAVYQSVFPDSPLARRFLEYYKTEGGETLLRSIVDSVRDDRLAGVVQGNMMHLSTYSEPPSLVRWMVAMEGSRPSSSLGSQSPYNLIKPDQLCDGFRITRVILRTFGSQNNNETVLALLQEGFQSPAEVVQALPPCAAFHILQIMQYYMLKTSSETEHSEWPAEAWSLVGRTDLAANMNSAMTPKQRDSKSKRDSNSAIDDDPDGLKEIEQTSAMLFPEDNRVREAAQLVCSSRPVTLRVDRPVEVSDHEFEQLKQKKLLLMIFRSLALPPGRGMLTLGTIKNPKATEKLEIPKICMKGKIPPTNATINLDMTECPADFLVWPYFHNGVAAGLRIPCCDELGEDFKVTRTYIRFNQPNPPNEDETDPDTTARVLRNHEHAGFLLALGLQGNLSSLEMSDIYEYLTEGSITTTVGLVLGIAANKRGSCDMSVSKMISLHIPSLIPQHFSAIDVASPVQTAAIAASGILFQSSSHRMMTEFLLNEIGKRPDTDVSTVDREAYSLACGLALGTVNLCHGTESGISDRAAGLSDLHIEERLIQYIVGGIDPDEERRKQESNDRFTVRSGAIAGESERCSTVYEGSEINSVLCSPGSILALGLMYMKSGNQSIAHVLALPQTHFLLEFVRPDFLGLRVIARSLILWKDVKPSKEWLESQIPQVIWEAREEISSSSFNSSYGTARTNPQLNNDFDQTAVRRMYVHIVAGACFGMGLRYAGTANKEAKKTILEQLVALNQLREVSNPVSAALRPEAPILDCCIGAAAISLAMVMAGTGDIEVLRLFRILRWRCEQDSRYGIHMIFGMSIGLLFLGGCTRTLGREPEDLAALITAFFPMFPISTPENHYHLQALRHLYVLAVRKRLIQAIDVDTGAGVHVPLEVQTSEERRHLNAPCLLPYTDVPWKQVKILSDLYYPLSITLTDVPELLYVKKRHKSLERSGKQGSIRELVPLASDSPVLNSFAEFVSGKASITSIENRALLEALSSTDETLLLYLKIIYGSSRYKAWNTQVLRACKQMKAPPLLPALHESMDRRIEELSEPDPELAELLFHDLYGTSD